MDTDIFGNTLNRNFVTPQQAQPTTPATATKSPVRKPGNFFTHALPIVGGVLGSIIGSPILGGAAGTGLGKVIENKLEQSDYKNKGLPAPGLASGVGGQALIGGIAGGIGEIPGVQNAIGAVTKPVSNVLGNILGRGATEAAGQAAARGATEATTEAGTRAGSELVQADTPVTNAVKDYLSSKGINVPENAIYKKGASLTASPRNLEGALKSSLGGPDTAHAGNLLLDTLGKGKNVLAQYNELPGIASTVKNDLSGVLAKNTSKVATEDLSQALGDIQAKALGGADAANMTTAQKLMAMKGDPELNRVFDTIQGIVNKAAGEDGKLTAQNMLDINTAIGREIRPAQWNALKGIGDAQLTEGDRALFNAWKLTRGQLEQMAPEASNVLRVQGLVSHDLPNALHHNFGGGSGGFGGVRTGFGGVHTNIPGAQKVIQGVQTSLGRGLQGAGGAATQAVETASRAVPQIAGQGIIDSAIQGQQQERNINGAGELSQTKFNTPSEGLQAIIQQYSGQSPASISGATPDEIRQAMVSDLASGGKNIGKLNTLLSAVNDMQSQSELPSSAISKLSDYQDSLNAIQGLSEAFSGQGSTTDVQSAVSNATKQLGSATGLSGKELVAALPSAYDDPQTVQVKLSALKKLADQKAEQDITGVIESNKRTSNQQSFLSSLVGAPA